MRITVVVPTYNSMKYIDPCLDSVLAQTYEDMDVIVYDNESTDETYEYLKDRKSDGEDFELVSIPNLEPNGYREAMDHVFEHSESDYVTFISSDDYVDKDYISKYMQIIDNTKVDIKCIQSGIIWVTEEGETVSEKIHNYSSMDEFKNLCLEESPVNNPTVVYHNSIWPILSECREAHFNNNLPDIGVGDYDMWCGLADRGVLVHSIPGHLGYFYRWHSDQCTWKVQENATNYDQMIKDYWRNKWE